jgi:hypothetical protein
MVEVNIFKWIYGAASDILNLTKYLFYEENPYYETSVAVGDILEGYYIIAWPVTIALFWVIMQWVVVIFLPISPIFKFQKSKKKDSCPLKVGLTDCPEMLVRSYQYSLLIIHEENRTHPLRGWSLNHA